MIATVVRLDPDGLVRVRVRRDHLNAPLDGRHPDLKIGDKIEVKRKINNPYLIRVKNGEQETQE